MPGRYGLLAGLKRGDNYAEPAGGGTSTCHGYKPRDAAVEPHDVSRPCFHCDGISIMRRVLPILMLVVAMAHMTSTQQPRTHDLPLTPAHVHWGYFDSRVPPVLRIASGDRVRVETMIAGGLQRVRLAGVAESEIPDSLKAVELGVVERGPASLRRQRLQSRRWCASGRLPRRAGATAAVAVRLGSC